CFFSSRRRHTRSKRDWSSDVCSSDLRMFPLSIQPKIHFFWKKCYHTGSSSVDVKNFSLILLSYEGFHISFFHSLPITRKLIFKLNLPSSRSNIRSVPLSAFSDKK